MPAAAAALELTDPRTSDTDPNRLPWLRFGSRRPEVGLLQQRLVEWLRAKERAGTVRPGTADSFARECQDAVRAYGLPCFGPQTYRRLEEFQRESFPGQDPDHVVGPQTWGKLLDPSAAPTAITPPARERQPGADLAPGGVHPLVLQAYRRARARYRGQYPRTGRCPEAAEADWRQAERWKPLIAQYFPAAAVDDAVRVVYRESGGRPDVKGRYSNDWGLFQINICHAKSYHLSSTAQFRAVMATRADQGPSPPASQVVNNIMAAFVIFEDARGRFSRPWVAARNPRKKHWGLIP